MIRYKPFHLKCKRVSGSRTTQMMLLYDVCHKCFLHASFFHISTTELIEQISVISDPFFYIFLFSLRFQFFYYLLE